LKATNISNIVKANNIKNDIKYMTDREFRLFSELIYNGLGIKMPPNKKLMLSSRLRKRLIEVGAKSYKEYYDYISKPDCDDNEFNRMIDAVTTNKTDFYREPIHFNVLKGEVLPILTQRERFKKEKIINIWSAGCSTGEEPYTLGFVLSDYFLGDNNAFIILATDISKQVLKKGASAIYNEEQINQIPKIVQKKYLLKGVGSKKGFYRIVPELRQKVEFRQLNLLETKFNIKTPMDIIFCRNVIIYFDRKTQIDLFDKFYNNIVPGGYLFVGSSESLHGISDKFKVVGPNIYQRPS
jgi:chemotaxis protein methyltransferase CheR